MLQGTSEPSRILFKKYGKNRRLYDTAAKRYVTLDELAVAVRRGAEVQVIDAETEEDLTPFCLTQIIMGDARDKPAGLPLELLRQLVIASDHAGREFIMWYLKSAFDAYHKVQNTLESGLSEVQSATRSPLQLVKNFIQGRPSDITPEQSELQELRLRMAELEQRLAHPERKQEAKKSGGPQKRKPKKQAKHPKSPASKIPR
jgi:polyhydroxyalkanoate synthesis repressor PhaR